MVLSPSIGIYLNKLLLPFLFAGVLFLLCPQTTLAATPLISNVPPAIQDNEPFTVNINLTVGISANKKYYLRGAFAQTATPKSYFGYTKNNNNVWYSGVPLDHLQFKEIQMTSDNTWSGVLEVKLDTTSLKYKGSGNYAFKVGYYREGGSFGEWSDSVQIAVTASSTPTPSPTPTPVSTSTPVPAATPTPKPATLKPTAVPTSIPTLVTSSGTTPKPEKIVQVPDAEVETKQLVLGVQSQSAKPMESLLLNNEATPSSFFAEWNNRSLAGFIITGSGLLLLSLSVYSFLKNRSSVKIKSLEPLP